MRKIDGEFAPTDAEADSTPAELQRIYLELIPKIGRNWYRHAGLGVNVSALARILYYSELYRQILDVPGVVCEFGVQWGATLAQLINLRSILEPLNLSRTMVGFDTFEGLPELTAEDGISASAGDYHSTPGYMELLSDILALHERPAPYSNMRKHELVKGDASETFASWLEANPQAVIAMAIFDMDLYKPTLEVLHLVKPRLTKGSLLVFDELNAKHFPGETQAVREWLGTENLRLRKSPHQAFCSWAVWGD